MLDDASRAWLDATLRGDTAEADRLGRVLDTATQLEQVQRDATSLLAAAVSIAATGIPVFPIQPRGKRPLTTHGFKDATTDPETTAAWWAQWPDANIGTPTGYAFDVIDVDGTEGLASLYNGASPVIDSVTVLGVALTSRPGGRHLYVPPAGHGNKTAIYPGVDYRGTGGYVVMPPSQGSNGVRYQWAVPLKQPGCAA